MPIISLSNNYTKEELDSFNDAVIGTNIKYYRTLRGYTQEEFAQKVGLQKQNISNIENGTRIPKFDKICDIADALGINPLWIYGINLDREKKIQLMYSFFMDFAEKIEINDDETVTVSFPKEFGGIATMFNDYQERLSRINDVKHEIEELEEAYMDSFDEPEPYDEDNDLYLKHDELDRYNRHRIKYWLDLWPNYDSTYMKYEYFKNNHGLKPEVIDRLFEADFIKYCQSQRITIVP